ncbi:MAG TPA: tRNA (N6-threonylcarbamoyladenosine(37)-N6)-methyltransferase TrmO [Spongiibacteraceae bacterium]|nr:tRNA (N6-threonylcarbamoyladenosine(37)-N6)-methyltransferase TrmO [Spongiibacteraceae bacterium]
MNDSTTVQFAPIGIAHSPYQEKFTIPRQPGLAKVDAVIELLPPFSQPEAVVGLDQFSHIWITFVFHAVAERTWKPLVRPPRLGGNEKIGVFATRSTHRPNPIGLSVVELIRIEIGDGVKLHIRGGDLLDGTPVLDIKPYIPYADAISQARAGYAQYEPPSLPVRWRTDALRSAQALSGDLQHLVEEVLRNDPRPAYQDEPERIYGVHLAGCNVRFRIDADGVEVIGIEVLRDGVPERS